MDTLKILKAILLLLEVLNYSHTYKSEMIETIKDWIEREEKLNKTTK